MISKMLKSHKKALWYLILITTLLSLIVYKDFILTNTPYLFTSSDAAHQFFPFNTAMYNDIYTDKLPMWSFQIGLGAPYIPNQFGDIFRIIPILFGSNVSNSIMVYMQIIKIVLSSVLFYTYLKKINLEPTSCFIGAIGYSFSGIMIIRGNWISYSTEIVLCALLLVCLERYFQDGKWTLLVFLISYIFIALSIFHIFWYTLFLILYLTIRYILSAEFNWSNYGRCLLKCAGIYISAMLISSIVLAPTLILSFDTGRSTSTQNTALGIDLIKHFKENLTIKKYIPIYMSLFPVDIMGLYHLTTSGDVLGRPILYCSLFFLLLFPQGIFFAKNKIKKVFIFLTILASLYLLSPTIVYASNLFIGTSYKLNSLWIIILILIVGAYGFNKCIINNTCNIKLLFTTFIVLAFTFVLFSKKTNLQLHTPTVVTTWIMLIIYVFVIYFMFNRTKGFHTSISLLVLVCIEALMFSFVTVNSSFKLVAAHISSQYNEYNDDFSKTITQLKEYDKDEFYRIFSTDNFSTFCNPLLYNYYSTTAYYSFLPQSMVNFKKILLNDENPSIFKDFGDRQWLNSLVSLKYLISDIEQEDMQDYLLFSNQKYFVYINPNALPLGFTYDTYISLEEFLSATEEEKDYMLLSGFVSDSDEDDYKTYTSNEFMENINTLFENIQFSIDSIQGIKELYDSRNDHIAYKVETFDNTPADPMIFINLYEKLTGSSYIEISFDITSEIQTQGSIFLYNSLSNTLYTQDATNFAIKEGTNNYLFKIPIKFYMDIVDSMRLDVGSHDGLYEIKNIQISHLSQLNNDRISDMYEQSIGKRRENVLEIIEFSNNKITGKINSEENNMLFLSIPYSKGWTATIDGEPVQISEINIGFLGIPLSAGYHDIEISFMLPGLVLGAVLSVSGIFLILIFYFMDKKFSLFSLPF